MYKVFRRIFRNLRQKGIRRTGRILVDRTCLRLLQKVYGFHPWHADAPLSARPYRRVVAQIVNGLKPQCVVDVGCGLGSILALVNAPDRYGYDIDAGAIKAARFLRSQDITFVHGDMGTVSQPHIDVLILVNWIHEISPTQLEKWLIPLLPRTTYLLLDAIDPDGPEDYRFKHDFKFLGSKARSVSIRRPTNECRSFHLYEVAG